MGRVGAGLTGRLPFDPAPLVVFRVRPDDEGRIEARWPALALCATFADWPMALDRVITVLNPLLFPGVAVRVLVRH